ncbi:MAG: alpha/beta-hydrolase family protein [Natronospirillum sp.]|uniref:alpha/beta hydrolase n=1 Tax=Natronospirillum sp. TaxID=2812955 RepID=UPI0025D76D61|nr:alpha/beta-hydrolase family protein [Natronospirillum sp.]MCH8553233.1 alpha/beta-hydrolase family protein [Natronospirillum sp.]
MKPIKHFNTTGLLLGTLFFAASLTPTLLPRGEMVQGVITGLSLSAGYLLGYLLHRLWLFLELPTVSGRTQLISQWLAAALFGLIAVSFLWQATEWQNQVRGLMGMKEDARIRSLWVGLIAVPLFLVLKTAAYWLHSAFLLIPHWSRRLVPRRISYVGGVMVAVVVFWLVIDGIVFASLLRALDRSYQQVDALTDPATEQPEDPALTGSNESLLGWETLGRQGRRFVTNGLDEESLAPFSDRYQPPIRVYAGLNSAETQEERAELALQELLRVDAFDRSVLALITPTGTGWIDPAAMHTLEALFHGDVASVAVQYSYLSSPLALMTESEYGADQARATFEVIYGHWRSLPADVRPDLYLHGLSLGALNSDRSFDLFDIIDDPFQGVLWSGPPFRTDTWRTATHRRDRGSPAWLPRFRDGQVIRFGNQSGGWDDFNRSWGNFRIGILQYASDPITLFDPSVLYQEPEWMQGERAFDVSPELRWIPVVTFLQLAADMTTGASPRGFGHDYSGADYLDAWYALTEPEGWSEEQYAELRAYFAERY